MAAKKLKPDNQTKEIVVAKQDNGTIQITFTVTWNEVKSAREEALLELSREVEIPGFRKGKAPVEKVREKISEETLIQKALSKILPQKLAKAITEYKISPAIYPKFELISAKEGQDWQIRAITCELPEVNLRDYKRGISGEVKSKNIWTPGKDDKEPTQQQKEAEVIRALLEIIKVDVPELLIQEEVNARLASLLERIERLGLQLESYLASVGKTPEILRSEYNIQAKNAIALDLILGKIALEEDIQVTDKQVDEAVASQAESPSDIERLNSPDQRNLVKALIRRRLALDYVVSLI